MVISGKNKFLLSRVQNVRLLLISHPFPWITGGFKRSYEVLRRFRQPGCDITLVLSPLMARNLVQDVLREQKDPEVVYSVFRELQELGITVHPGSLRLIDDLFLQHTETLRTRRTLISLVAPVIPAHIGMSRMLSRYLQNYLQDLGTYDLIYSHHECLDTAMLAQRLSDQLRIPVVILLHNEPFQPVQRILKIWPISSVKDIAALVPALNMYLSTRYIYHRIITSIRFRRFLAISPAPLVVSGLSSVPHTILNPANALNDGLFLQTGKKWPKKGNYALFASRFADEKGIFELPYIWKKIHEEMPDMKLIVYGNSSEEALRKFQDIVHHLLLEDTISVQGYLPDEREFYHVVSQARVLIHPSHSDGFAMIILESLAQKTPVVAYDLPAFTYYYQNFRAVELVREWDQTALSRAAVRAMKNEEEYAGYLENPPLLEFIRHHSSWEDVAHNELEVLISLSSQ
jgi:glycosyltransferase involved in cell wall biosynthesis